MSVKYVILIVFLFIIFNLCLIPLGNQPLNSQASTDLNTLTNFGVVKESETFGFLEYVRAPLNYFQAFFRVMVASSENQEVLFHGTREIIRWIIMAPLFAGVVFGLVILFFSAFRRTI